MESELASFLQYNQYTYCYALILIIKLLWICGIFHFTLRLHRAPQKSYHLLVPWGFREHLLSPSVLGDQWRCVREGHSCKEVFASTV